MDLRGVLAVLRRRRWLIVEAVVLAIVVGAFVGRSRTPQYQATARVLLLPNDPNESIGTSNSVDPVQNSTVQAQLVKSPSVALAVGKDLKADPNALAAEVTVGGQDVLNITATDADPNRAVTIANAFANEYINDRKQHTVAGLQQAADDIARRLAQVQTQLNGLDAQISAASGAAGAAASPGAPASSAVDALNATRSAVGIEFQDLYSRQQELLVDQSLARGNAEVIGAAGGASRSGTSTRNIVLFAALAGLAVGLGAAFLREQLDDRVRARADVEEASGLPVLAELPFDRRAVREVLNNGLAPPATGALVEAARVLRTSINFLGVRGQARRLLVTSPGAREGKTLVSAMLAALYARAGYDTVLISADLRHPDLDRVFGIGPDHPGLTNTLVGSPLADHQVRTTRKLPGRAVTVHTDSVLLPTSVEHLTFLPSGQSPPNPSELLASARMREVLDELAHGHDICIIDSAPLLAVSDTLGLVDRVDGVVMVTALGQTRRGAIRRARQALEPAEINWLGVVINKSRRHQGPSDTATDEYYYLPAPRGPSRGVAVGAVPGYRAPANGAPKEVSKEV